NGNFVVSHTDQVGTAIAEQTAKTVGNLYKLAVAIDDRSKVSAHARPERLIRYWSKFFCRIAQFAGNDFCSHLKHDCPRRNKTWAPPHFVASMRSMGAIVLRISLRKLFLAGRGHTALSIA